MITWLSASIAPAEMVDVSSYDSWRWGGFNYSSSSDAGITSVFALSSSSETPGKLSGTSGLNSYNKWQWGGFSRSTTSAAIPTADISLLSSSTPIISPSAVSLLAAASSGNTLSTTISGYVFYDENGNGIDNDTDWAILDAEVALYKSGSSTPSLITYTDTTGKFTFTNLPSGTYSIALLTPTTDPPGLILGKLYESDGTAVANAGQIIGDMFEDITVGNGYLGINYAFCLNEYPAGAVSKRLLIDGVPQHMPEPATYVLLAMAGLMIGAYARSRRRA